MPGLARQMWRWTRPLGRAVKPVMGVVFPESCWVTREPVDGGEGLSDKTREAVVRGLLWPFCRGCGATVGHGSINDTAHPCLQCEARALGLAGIVRVGTYDEPLSGLVRQMKFERKWGVARVLGPFLYQAIAMELARQESQDDCKVDTLIPVALHWRRCLWRGFNQAEELAHEAGRLGGWPVWDVLKRVKATGEQSLTQSAHQRRENLRGAFACIAGKKLAGKHVWLVDDVCTTGATLQAAAIALRKMPKAQRPASIRAAILCVTDRVKVPEGAAGE